MTWPVTEDELLREVYGDPDALMRERYGSRYGAGRTRRVTALKTPPAVTTRPRRRSFTVVGPAVVHDCGHEVYREARDGAPAALPARCWFCGGEVVQ